MHKHAVTMRNLAACLATFAATSLYASAAHAACSAPPDPLPPTVSQWEYRLADPVSLATARSMQFADVNGDGEADLCHADGSTVTCNLRDYSSECDSFGSRTRDITLPFSVTSHERFYETLSFPDLNGDDWADVCVRGTDGVYCALAGQYDFGTPTRWSYNYGDNYGWSLPYYYKTVDFPDVNGDGKADICGRGSAGIYCAISSGSSFSTATLWTQPNQFSNAYGWANSPSYYETIQYPDVDGDGNADVCARASGGIYCALSRPVFNEFEHGTYWTSQFQNAYGWTSPQYYSTIQFGDINGDGQDDVCGRGGLGIYCGISEGDTQEQFIVADILDAPHFSNAGGWASVEHYQTIVLTDVDGDGNKDVCGRDYDGIYCARARSFWQGWWSGWTDLFNPRERWIHRFGDDWGWGSDEIYWGTVQPTDVNKWWPGTEFCGRSTYGVQCSYK